MRIFITILLVIIVSTNKNAYSQKELLGMTRNGGLYNGGAIFKTDSNGNNFQNVYSFLKTDGWDPGSGLSEYTNGVLYGLTAQGGNYNLGTLYEFNPAANSYSKKIDFDTVTGSNPLGFLFLASDGKFYGLTSIGGVNGFGTIFNYDPISNTLTKIFDFDGVNTGESPIGSLVQAPNGKLFGTTYSGGTHSFGVIFSFDPVTYNYTKLLDFDGLNTGSYPREGMILADSMLYGTAGYGGTNNFGLLYQLDPDSGTFIKKFEFDNITTGSPEGSLTQASNGLIYGLSEFGVIAQSPGQLFEYDPVNNILIVKYEGFSAINGMRPSCKLTEVSNGILLGMTLYGGVNNLGVIWEYDIPNDTFFVRHEFDGINGASPYGTSIYKTSAGKLFGVATDGGVFDGGCLFEFDSSSFTLNKITDFDKSLDGIGPSSNFVLASNGKLYSMTLQGGNLNEGVLFEFDPLTYTYSKRVDFDKLTIGGLPEGSLLQAANGKLYGLTSKGGNFDDGVLFEYDPVSFSYNKLFDFENTVTGALPYGSLVQAGNGFLYGLTSDGGTNNLGTIFEFDISNDTLIKKFDFDGAINGSAPMGSLVEGSNNMLYGLTSSGGAQNAGVLFQFNPFTNNYTKHVDFIDTVTGSRPMGSLIKAANNRLYGLASNGGMSGNGALFEYNTTNNTILVKQSFDNNVNAYDPEGSLYEASNGKFYGTTFWGGQNDEGIFFEFDTVSNAINKKFDFSNAGTRFSLSDIIEIDLSLLNDIVKIIDEKLFDVYPNPANDKITMTSKDNSTKMLDITISDLTGKVIYKNNNARFPFEVDLNNISSGFYFIRLMIDNSVFVQKIIKQ